MVNNEPAGAYSHVLAAVDISNASAQAVQYARSLRFFDDTSVSIAHAFEPLAKSKLAMVGAPQGGIEDYVAQEHLRVHQELDAFLHKHQIGEPAWTLRVEEGDPFQTIARLVTEMVIGTHNRSGVAKMFLGSVAQEVLRTIEVDILTVPLASAACG